MNEEKKPLMITYNGEDHMGLTITPEKLEISRSLLGRYPTEQELKVLMRIARQAGRQQDKEELIRISGSVEMRFPYTRRFLKCMEQQGVLRVIDLVSDKTRYLSYGVQLASPDFISFLSKLAL